MEWKPFSLFWTSYLLCYLVYFAGTKETKIWMFLSVFLIELIWAGCVLFGVGDIMVTMTLWNRQAWEYTYIANYRMRDEDMRETAGRGSASSDLSHWADSRTPLAAAPMIDGSPVSPFLLRRVTPNGRYTKVRELKEDFFITKKQKLKNDIVWKNDITH